MRPLPSFRFENSSIPYSRSHSQDVAAAYEALSDDDKRKTYDARGEEGLSGNNGHNPTDVFSRSDRHLICFSLTNFSMFGGAFHAWGGQQRGNEPAKGNTVNVDLEVTLEQLYNGHTYDVFLTTVSLLIDLTVPGAPIQAYLRSIEGNPAVQLSY